MKYQTLVAAIATFAAHIVKA